MDDIYEWLYDEYAAPRLLDLMENIRLQWGTELFALGIRFGGALAAPRAPKEDWGRLAHFLPQLDDPVS